MLYFYIKNIDHLICTMTSDDIIWLKKFNFIKDSSTGLLEDDGVETLPFFDDYDIGYNDALFMRQFAKNELNKINKIQGFKSVSLDKFLVIINTIIEKKITLNVVCD